jgi:hypothetical protein
LFLDNFLNKDFIALLSVVFAVFIFKYTNNKIPVLIKTSIDVLKSETVNLKSTISYSNNFVDFLKKLEKSFIKKAHYSNLNIFVFRDKDSDLDIPYLIKNIFYKELKGIRNILVYEEIDYLDFPDKQKEVLKN